MRLAPILALSGTLACPALAADWQPIEGTYVVTARNYLDPPGDEAADTHFRLQLTGDAAADLYRAMKVAEAIDECTGAKLKRIGELRCLHYEGERAYACNFSLNVASQEIEQGVAC